MIGNLATTLFIGVHQYGVKINREGKNLLFAVLIYFTNVITITHLRCRAFMVARYHYDLGLVNHVRVEH